MKAPVVLLISCLISLVVPHNVYTGASTSALPQAGHRDAALNGEAAVGSLISEEKDKTELKLDVTPCRESSQSSRIITFRKEYKKKSLGTMSCFDGKTYEAFQVVQMKRR